ncbi:hypothetical protein IQ07DRAFT_585261 [Pyrenochaeta sp. DS3sAY3a]|nr:hypothetical protein IQ07DRAFT_585261 [Pyrenochaeta sp. DS3sAY3a]
MRFSIVAAVAAFSSTVLAQNLLDQIPKCAQDCFGNSLGTCRTTDIACICGNKEVINSVSCCVFATCPQSDIQSTIDFAVNLCKIVNIEVSTTPDCPSNGTSTNSTTTPSASASTTPSVTALTGSNTPSAAGVSSTGAAAPFQTAGAGLGLGMAMAGLFALL